MYCSVADLDALLGRHRVAAWGDDARIEQAIRQASAEIDGYLVSAGYDLPLQHFAAHVQAYAVDLAAYNLAAARGMSDDASDEALRDKAQAARHYFRGIASGKYRLYARSSGDFGTDDEQVLGGGGYGLAAVHSHVDLRGYYD